MARGLFAGRGAVGGKMRKMREKEGQTARLRPELAPTSPERKLIKSPIEKMVPEGSAKMVAVRPTVTQIAQDVQTPTGRGEVMGAAAPAAIQAQGAVAVAKDGPISREVARTAAMDVIQAEMAAETRAAAPIVGEAAVTAPQRVATTQAPARTVAPVQGQVLGAKAQEAPLHERTTRIGATYVGRPVSGRYVVEGQREGKTLASAKDKDKKKRWQRGNFV